MDRDQDTRTPENPRDHYSYDPDDPIGNALHDGWVFIRDALREANTGERLTFVSNVALLIIAIVAASIYGCQLHQMTAATVASESTARTASDALRIDDRAWVTVTKIETIRDECSWRAIVFKNSGKSPALNFQIYGAAEPVHYGAKPSAREQLMPGKGIISPEGIFHSCIGNKKIDSFDWSNSDFVVHGRITYDDIFTVGHWTTFCYARSKEQEFHACESGNDIDRNDINKER